MSKDDGPISEFICPFIRNQNWDEINQLDNGLLVGVDLAVLDLD
jgi:hypothetical protein